MGLGWGEGTLRWRPYWLDGDGADKRELDRRGLAALCQSDDDELVSVGN